MTAASIGHHLLKELKTVIPPTIYFFCAFNIIAFTSDLVVHHYWFALSNFMLATVMALIVGKVILVTDHFRFVDRYRGRPLWRPILFKAAFYTVVVLLVRMAEAFVHAAWDERGFRIALGADRNAFTWQHFTAVQVWLFVSFLVYVTVTELSALSGKSFVRLLFQRAQAIP